MNTHKTIDNQSAYKHLDLLDNQFLILPDYVCESHLAWDNFKANKGINKKTQQGNKRLKTSLHVLILMYNINIQN